MAQGYDGRALIARLTSVLDPGASILELGSGPGKDLDILQQHFRPTGSDLSLIFRDNYLKEHPGADWLTLDAVSLDTERRFDAIYSNKVLHHLQEPDLRQSFIRQSQVLRPGGIILHSFWRGSGSEEMEGLYFAYYEIDTLKNIIPPHFEVLDCSVYTEMDQDDSILLLARLAVSPDRE